MTTKKEMMKFQIKLGWTKVSDKLITKDYGELGKYRIRYLLNKWILEKATDFDGWIKLSDGKYLETILTQTGAYIRPPLEANYSS